MDSRYLDALAPEQRREFTRDLCGRQGGVCFICEQPIDLDLAGEDGAELDHITPPDAGGVDGPDNLAVVHAACASQRSVRDLGLARELVRLRRAVEDVPVAAQAGATDRPVATDLSAATDLAPPPAGPVPEPTADDSSGWLFGRASAGQPTERSGPAGSDHPVQPAGSDELDELDELAQLARRGERSYGSALGLTVVGAAIPGSAYLAAGRRRLGLITLGVVAVLLLAVAVVVLANDDLTSLAAELISRPTLLDVIGILGLVAAAAWIVVIATGHRMLLPRDTSGTQRSLGVVLTVVLSLLVAVPSIIASRYAFATHDLIEEVFDNPLAEDAPPIDRADPWNGIPRLNLLIIGGDSTPDGGLTTNTMIIASIDTSSGDAAMFGLPRNLQNAPIPEDNPLHAVYPTGYRCGGEPTSCLLSGLYTEAKVAHADLFGDELDPGLTTLRGSVSEMTGLEINYSMVVDLAGFEQMVDALGGIDINVGQNRVPIVDLDAGGNPLPTDESTRFIQPGQQHLDGEEALAFARERRSDGFSSEERILRQRVVILGIVARADPVNVLLSYLDVASTASDAIKTDVPAALLPALVDLSKLVRAQEIRNLPITPDVDPANPNFDYVRQLVQTALSE